MVVEAETYDYFVELLRFLAGHFDCLLGYRYFKPAVFAASSAGLHIFDLPTVLYLKFLSQINLFFRFPSIIVLVGLANDTTFQLFDDRRQQRLRPSDEHFSQRPGSESIAE